MFHIFIRSSFQLVLHPAQRFSFLMRCLVSSKISICMLFFGYTVYISLFLQFISVVQSCLTLCDAMDCSKPGFPVHHQLLELTQTHVHRVSDAIHASHPLSPPSPLALNFSQHQGLFQQLHTNLPYDLLIIYKNLKNYIALKCEHKPI